MNGISADHQIKTKDGWKLFGQIDINKDELYCWEFSAIDDDPSQLNYSDSISYIKPLKKYFVNKNNLELYQIKNEYIDTIVTKDYKLPVALANEDDRYANWSELAKPLDLIEYLKDAEMLKKQNKYSYGMKCFSESVSNSSFEYYDYEDLYFQIKLDDIKKLETKDKYIICFLAPNIEKVRKDLYKYWRIYVRRNGKEFWI